MKQKNDCFTLLIEMLDCICENKHYEVFDNAYNRLQNILRTEYFTPFDREDIYMISVKLDYLYKAVNNTSTDTIKPLLNKIKSIILLFQNTEKNKFRNIFNSISEYRKFNTDELILSASNKTEITNLIKKCNETVIQIEYTILKNS